MKLKKSPKRDRILEVIRGTKSHPTAEWVYLKLKDEMPELSLATVYRNLEQLTEAGELLKLSGDTSRFDGNTEGHYHITCEKCKRVFDLPAPYEKDLAERLAAGSGFLITGYTIDFRGICSECIASEEKNKIN